MTDDGPLYVIRDGVRPAYFVACDCGHTTAEADSPGAALAAHARHRTDVHPIVTIDRSSER